MEKINSNKRFKIFITLAGISVLFLIINSFQSCTFSRNTVRDSFTSITSGRSWAQPVNSPGLPNLYKVSDNLYRGAQPTKEGFKNLKQLGIKTVINLREFHSDKSQILDSNFIYVSIDTATWDIKDNEVSRFLQTVRDKDKQPVFVHCKYGSDRTGLMCAVYRISVEGWSKQQAIDEMTKGGFGYHPAWHNLITYIQKFDPNKMK
jgi:tyrosine-protein phosphatase SIW14